MMNGEKHFILNSNLDRYDDNIVWRQYLAAVLASLVSMATGCAGGWSSAAVPLLLSGNATDLGIVGTLSYDQASWITSFLNVGCMVGSLPAGQLSFRLGRRKFLLYVAYMLVFGWLLILFNFNNVVLIYAGRFICGFVTGSVCVALSMYATEVCSDVIRGRSGSFYDMMQVFGILYVYCVSAIFSLFWSTVFCILVPVIFLITFSRMPESPIYLLSHGRRQEAINCIKWFHGNQCDVDKHLIRIQVSLLAGKEHSLLADEDNSSIYLPYVIRKFFKGLREKNIVKPFFIVLVLFFVQRSGGAPVITYYAQEVFTYSDSNVTPSLATVFLGLIQFLCSICGFILVDRVGRRFLLILSLSTMIISIGIFISFVYASESGWDIISTLGWLPVATICTFVGAFRLGIGPIPWFLSSELIPIEDQRWIIPTVYFVAWGVMFASSKNYLAAVSIFGFQNVFIIYMIICAIGLLHTIYFVPETKHKSRAEIQNELRSQPVSYMAI